MKDLIVLHGALGSAGQLGPLKDQLSSYFRVHTLDFSGHGEAPFAKEFGIIRFTHDLRQLIDRLNAEKIDIVGYSMGGYVALNLASIDKRIGRIVTLGTKFGWNPEASRKEITHLVPDLMQQKVPHFARLLDERHTDWKRVVTATADMMISLGKNPILNDTTLPAVENKVLVMLAEKDTMVTEEESRHATNLMPNATFRILPDSKHPIEQVDMHRLVTEITNFLL